MRTAIILASLAVLILLAPIGVVQSVTAPRESGSSGLTTASPSQDPLSFNGVDPTAISLTWQESSDIFFEGYSLQYSTAGSNGPWTQIASWGSGSKTTTSDFVYELSPSTTSWWELIDHDI